MSSNGLKVSVDAESPRVRESYGVYYIKEVAQLLKTSDVEARGTAHVSFTSQLISSWCKYGFASLTVDLFAKNRKYLGFNGMITLRMVGILRSNGVSMPKVRAAHDYLVEQLRTTWPFVNRLLWTEDTEIAEDVYAHVNNLLVTASRYGQLPFTELLRTKIIRASEMEFDENHDVKTWYPHDLVSINPRVHSGVPCFRDTRLAISEVYEMYRAGEALDELASVFELDLAKLSKVFEWQEALQV